MSNLDDLYREIILDHYRNPRNRGELASPPAHRVEGFNPLCGDEITVYFDVVDGVTYKIDLTQPPRYDMQGKVQNPNARRIVDLSIYLENDVVSDPPGFQPRIEYVDHRQSREQMLGFFPGLTPADLPDGEAWSIEKAP